MNAPGNAPVNSPIEPALRISRILHLALTSSLVIYAVIAQVVGGNPPGPGTPSLEQRQPLLILLAVLALALVVAQPTLRRRFLPPRRTASAARDPLPAGPLPARAQGAIQRYYTAQLLCWSLTEAIALLGLILAIVVYDPRVYYPFGGVALVQMLLLAPRRDEMEAVVRAALGAGDES